MSEKVLSADEQITVQRRQERWGGGGGCRQSESECERERERWRGEREIETEKERGRERGQVLSPVAAVESQVMQLF